MTAMDHIRLETLVMLEEETTYWEHYKDLKKPGTVLRMVSWHRESR